MDHSIASNVVVEPTLGPAPEKFTRPVPRRVQRGHLEIAREIRTMVSTIDGVVGLLQSTTLDRLQRDYVETVRQSARGLMDLVRELSHEPLSNMTSGKPAPVDLRRIVDEVVDAVAGAAWRKGVDVLARLSADTPQYVYSSATKLNEILKSLTENMIRCTARGCITLDVINVKAGAHSNLLRFCVRAPFDQADAQQAVTAFTASDGESSADQRFCQACRAKTFIRRLKGQSGAEIDVDGYVQFWFELELPTHSGAPTQRHVKTDLFGVPVLIVDDARANCEALEGLLSAAGARATSVSSAKQALEAVYAAAKADLPYGLILCDLNLSGKESIAFCQQVRGLIPSQSSLVLMAFDEDVRRRPNLENDACVDGIVTKPLSANRVLLQLATVLRERRDAMRPAHQATRTRVEPRAKSETAAIEAEASGQSWLDLRDSRPMKVLVVEDNPLNQKAARLMLDRLNTSVDIARNGKQAVEMVETKHYDLVLMDCQMPVMDGWEATRQIRQLKGPNRNVPIVAVTAGALQGDREKSVGAGMDGFLTKPVMLDSLRRVIERWRNAPPRQA